MGDENPSLEIPMKNWSLKTPCLLLTGATPIKKTEKLSICEKNKTSNPKNQKNKNKKRKTTHSKQIKQIQNIAKNNSKQMPKHKKIKETIQTNDN